MMKIIMKYFTYEGRFSWLYSYHIWLLMHFTRVRMLHIRCYLSCSIDKMAYIVQNRDYNHQMKSLFHHSLIKMIFMHQLEQKNISWDTFIANEIFTTPPCQHEQSIPSSSHPPIYSSPSQPISHTSSPIQIISPHVDPTSSPFHNPSSSHHDIEPWAVRRTLRQLGLMWLMLIHFPRPIREATCMCFIHLEWKGPCLFHRKNRYTREKKRL